MPTTRVFKNGNSQAVRIPAELAYERNDIDVEIERVGDELRIRPARRSLAGVLEKFAKFSPTSWPRAGATMTKPRGTPCMALYMLDTNICIYLMKKQPKEVARRFAQCSSATSSCPRSLTPNSNTASRRQQTPSANAPTSKTSLRTFWSRRSTLPAELLMDRFASLPATARRTISTS